MLMLVHRAQIKPICFNIVAAALGIQFVDGNTCFILDCLLAKMVRDGYRITYIHGKNSRWPPHFNEFMRIGNKIKIPNGEEKIKANCILRWSGYPISFGVCCLLLCNLHNVASCI